MGAADGETVDQLDVEVREARHGREMGIGAEKRAAKGAVGAAIRTVVCASGSAIGVWFWAPCGGVCSEGRQGRLRRRRILGHGMGYLRRGRHGRLLESDHRRVPWAAARARRVSLAEGWSFTRGSEMDRQGDGRRHGAEGGVDEVVAPRRHVTVPTTEKPPRPPDLKRIVSPSSMSGTRKWASSWSFMPSRRNSSRR